MPIEAGEEKKPTDDGPAVQVYRDLEVAHLGKGSSQEILRSHWAVAQDQGYGEVGWGLCVRCCPTPRCLSHSILSLSEIL